MASVILGARQLATTMNTRTQRNPILFSGQSRSWSRYRLDCAALTAAGTGRARNEDHCVFAAPGDAGAERAAAGYLFAVIDGDPVGGNGRSAARETGTSLLEILDDPRCLTHRPDLLMLRLQDANFRCHEFIEGRCSVTAAWIWEEAETSGLQVGWAQVGDTRLYHHHRGGWSEVTRVHAKGRLLDRAIGQGAGLVVDRGTLRLHPEERLVLVSRGVWGTSRPGNAVSGGAFPATADAVRRIVGQARLDGSREDTSAIVITARTIDADPEPEH